MEIVVSQYQTIPKKRRRYGDKIYKIEYASSPVDCAGGITIHEEYYKQRYVWGMSANYTDDWFLDGDYPEDYNEVMTEEEQAEHVAMLRTKRLKRKEKIRSILQFWRTRYFKLLLKNLFEKRKCPDCDSDLRHVYRDSTEDTYLYCRECYLAIEE